MIRLEASNDTIMMRPSLKQEQILTRFLKHGILSSSEVYRRLSEEAGAPSLVTVKRELARLAEDGFLTASGKGRARAYAISARGRLFTPVDAQAYCALEPDRRYGLDHYNFDLLPAWPSDLFTTAERTALDEATAAYRRRTAGLPPAIAKKELERLIVELSWKSSKIEGNTYTLLDTEKLILQNKKAPGHDAAEAAMIINHKNAFAFVREHAKKFRTLTRANLEEVHRLLVKNLGVGRGLRHAPVGVTGSRYRPLDNIHQIRETVDVLAAAISRSKTPYDKALTALLGLSYIQSFEDGNKRTARLAANALLLAHGCAPLSYRSVDENEYRAATIAFYELNTIVPFKKIFTEQYVFAAKNYAVM